MNESRKDLNDILSELHKVLDDLSLETGVKEKLEPVISKEPKLDELVSDNKIKKEDIALDTEQNVKLNTLVNDKEKEIFQESKEFYVEDKKEPLVDKQTVAFEQNHAEQQQDLHGHLVNNNNTEKVLEEKLPQETKIKESQSQESIVIKQEDINQTIINTIIIYPKSIPDAKQTFYDQVNTTLKRVSKKPVRMISVWELQYENSEQDLIKNYNWLLSQIKTNDVKGLFFITNEAVILDDFIKKVAMEVFMIKSIKYSELKSKSIYLDIAIDILLTVK